jgi:glycosyltransferase involved in cell wall biosynthesis
VRAIVFPHLRWLDIITFVIVYPFVLATGRKIVLVLHDIHGYYSSYAQWRLLIHIRSAMLAKLPNVIPLFNSVYTLTSVQKTFNVSLRKKAVVLYPFTRVKVVKGCITNNKGRFVLVFTKIGKIDLLLLRKTLMIFKELSSRGHANKLIIAGAATEDEKRKFVKTLNELISNLGLRSNTVELLFNVSSDLKESLLASASIIFYLSPIEGLGLPVIEALEFLKPVYAPRRTALRELVPKTFDFNANIGEILKSIEKPGDEAFSAINMHISRIKVFQLKNLLKLIRSIS